MSGVQTGALPFEAKIVKVFPHLFDAKGRNFLYSNLFEKDEYQVHLREDPREISGRGFDLQLKSGGRRQPLKLKIEVRGSKLDVGKIVTLETEVQPSRMFSKWSSLTVDKQKHQEIGEVTAWRATLWDGNEQIAEQESFLW